MLYNTNIVQKLLERVNLYVLACRSQTPVDAEQPVQIPLAGQLLTPGTSGQLSQTPRFAQSDPTTPTTSVATISANVSRYGSWPLFYQLPPLPDTIQRALNTELDFSFISDHRTGNRTRLVQCLFEDMVTYGW